jgi:diguanylate cyclase (GGDEF)-like protein
MQMQNIVLMHNELPDETALSAFSPFKSVLAQVFAATDDVAYVRRVLAAVKQTLPQATILGCSSDGTIDNGVIHPYGQTVQVTLTGFKATDLTLAYGESAGDSQGLGTLLRMRLLKDDTKVVIAFTEAGSVNGELFLEGMGRDGHGPVVIGGVASTPSFTDTFVIADEHILQSGAAAVALGGDALHYYQDFLFGWEPIGKEMTVTRVKNNVIFSIDNQSPLSIFRHYLGDEITDALPGIGSAFPLILKRGGENIARGIIALDGESLVVSGNVKHGDKVYIGYGNAAMITQKNDFNSHLQKHFPAPEALFNYYCEGRHLFLPRDAVEIEAERLSENGASAGCFTLGEFYTRQKNTLHNFSSTVLALSENGHTGAEHGRSTAHTLNGQEKLSAMVTKGLFHLIDVRTRELEHQSYHDPTTTLPNRTFFNEMLAIEIEKARKKHTGIALLFMDLDHFKDVNDTLGHGSGDLLLQELALRIESILMPTDLMARWSGDEFVILRGDYRSLDGLADLAAAIIGIFDEPIRHEGHHFSLGISIGISLYPNDGHDAETLVKNADAAMYAVKFSGRNHFSFYHKEMTEKALARITMENDLRIALKEESFFLVYQPQIDLKSGKVRSAEALLRWRHPEKGIIMPEAFIAIAEQSGLILSIGEQVFDMALRQLKTWKARGLPIEKVCVNVSAKQFRYDNIIDMVNRYLDKYALRPEDLEIELTESTLMKHSSANLKTLDELHRIGVSVSIDDFGTGYSSLSYLKRFKINNIKIDKSFVEHLPEDANDKAIVKAIIALAHTLGLDVIVEGVENSRQKAFFVAEGCAMAQGFYYGKPTAPDIFEKTLLSDVSAY